MTFREFLTIPRKWTRYQAMFVHDALADRTLPNVTTWEALRAHIPRRPGGGLLEEARFVWDAYQTALKRDLPA